MAYAKLIFRVHAITKMHERSISEANVRHVLSTGEIIRTYPEDKPYPSYLVLGWLEENRPIHVVAADNHEDMQTIVITVYEPDPNLWESDFKRKKQS